MNALKIGAISGLVSVLLTTVLNVLGRTVGILPESLDLKYMSELFIDPGQTPIAAFWLGVLLHIVGGILVGMIFIWLIRSPSPLNGIVFSLVAVWMIMMVIVMPIRGRGFFGLTVGSAIPVATFLLNVLYGAVVGWIAQRIVMAQNIFGEQIDKALTRAFEKVKEEEPAPTIDIESARIIIFSDLHKGARNGADDFRVSERAYNAALAYYFEMGHTLAVLGDAEELWEEHVAPVIKSYQYTLERESLFHHKDRYWRFWGNHDDLWSNPDAVKQHLQSLYSIPVLKVREGMRIRITYEGQEVGVLFLVHGHQGTDESDRLAFFSRWVVRWLWRPFQRVTGISLNTPAKSWLLRDQHNLAMYNWATKQEKLILITGHTHRPVFRSRTHVAKIREELRAVETKRKENPEDLNLRERVAQLRAELEWVLAQEGQTPGEESTVPLRKECYFNTGCCCYYDGDITGIEIVDGEIRLVRWPDDEGSPEPKILDRAKLQTVFASV